MTPAEALQFMIWIGNDAYGGEILYSRIIDSERLKTTQHYLETDTNYAFPFYFQTTFRLRELCDLLTFKINGKSELMTPYENSVWAGIKWNPKQARDH